jgi:Uma2 family endonuclease
LLIEILSPGSHPRDRVLKLEAYRKSGVPNYWLVDPVECTIEAFILNNELYALAAAACGNEVFSHSAFPGLEILLKDVWFE